MMRVITNSFTTLLLARDHKRTDPKPFNDKYLHIDIDTFAEIENIFCSVLAVLWPPRSGVSIEMSAVCFDSLLIPVILSQD